MPSWGGLPAALAQGLPPVTVAGYVLAALAVILAAARLVGGLFVRFGQPRVVGEMISGVLVGPTVLGGGLTAALYPPASLAFLGVLGTLVLVLFTFLVGLEVPQQLLRGHVGRVVTIGLAVVAASVALGFAVAALLDEPGLWRVTALADGRAVPSVAHALLIGSGIAATALPVVARILQDKGLVATPVGALGIGAAAVVTPLTFLVIAVAAAAADGQSLPGATATRVALTAALAAVLFGFVRPLLSRLLHRRFRAGEGLDGGLFAVLLVGALLTGAAAEEIGVQAFTGGLLFGAAVPQVAGLAEAVGDRLRAVLVVFGIPVFLAVSGLQTNLRLVGVEHAYAVALFLAAIVVAKFGVGLGVGRAVGLPVGQAGAVGVLMACGGLVTLVVALAARQVGLITPSMQVVFVVAAILTTLATGPLLDRFLAVSPAAPHSST